MVTISASGLTLIVLMSTTVEEKGMRKEDYVPPIFADGPSLDDKAFEPWVKAQEEVKLPFTIWRKPKRTGAIGVHTSKPQNALRFVDYKLGIPLDERLRMLCGEADPCAVWLSGRLGGAIPLEPASEDVFEVFAVHGGVDKQATLHAQFIRGPACLAIRALKPTHCARGPARCEKCKAAEKEPAMPKLLDVCPYGDYARPTIDIERDGKKLWRPYDVIRSFASADEAREFAALHRISDVRLSFDQTKMQR